MKRFAYRWTFATACACALLLSGIPDATAKKDHGKVPPGHAKKAEYGHGSKHDAHHTSTPPGWSRGKKVGWQGRSSPPGWNKWDKHHRDRWVRDRDHAVGDIDHVIFRYDLPRRKRNEIIDGFNQAVLGGYMINDAKNRVVDALKDDRTRRGLLIDTTQSVLELFK